VTVSALEGRRILVTRPRELAAGLAALIAQAGGEAVLFPAVEIRDPDDVDAARAALGRAEEFDLAVFVSPSAVRKALELRARPWPARVRAAALGAGTRRELEARGVRDVIAPREGADSEALLALPELQRLEGRRVLVLRGAGGRELLAGTLAARGARVAAVECYRRVRPAAVAAPAGTLDAVCANSAETLENLVALVGLERLRGAPLIVPHERVARLAREMGFTAVAVSGPGDAQVLARLLAYFGGAK
jgi:uroporphyrinogen-III synthase